MDAGPEVASQPASVHTDPEADLQPPKKHTDLEFGTPLPPEMHKEPKPQLLAVPVHSDPEPAQAPVQEEELDTSASKPGGCLFHLEAFDSSGHHFRCCRRFFLCFGLLVLTIFNTLLLVTD